MAWYDACGNDNDSYYGFLLATICGTIMASWHFVCYNDIWFNIIVTATNYHGIITTILCYNSNHGYLRGILRMIGLERSIGGLPWPGGISPQHVSWVTTIADCRWFMMVLVLILYQQLMIIIMIWNANGFQWEFQESAWRGCRSIPAEEICWDTPQSSPNFTMKKWQNWGYPHVFPFFLTPKLSIAVLVVCEIVVKPSRPRANSQIGKTLDHYFQISSDSSDLGPSEGWMVHKDVVATFALERGQIGSCIKEKTMCCNCVLSVFSTKSNQLPLASVFSMCFSHVLSGWNSAQNTCKIHLEPGAATFTVALKVVKITYLARQKSLQDIENTGIGHGSKSRIEQN